MIIKLILFCLILLFPHGFSYSQDIGVSTMNQLVETDDEFYLIDAKLRGYLEDLELLVAEIDLVSEKRLEQIEAKLQQMNAKHSFYCQAQQMYIIMNDSLMNHVAHYQHLEREATDAIEKQHIIFRMLDDFTHAESYIMSLDSLYERMLRQSFLLSQTEKTASELEKVKEHEQLIFTDVEKQFQQAKRASETIPALKIRYNKLEEKYIRLKNTSEKIQLSIYQPFIQRVKDELISIAAIGVILMFINTIVTKIQEYKQIRESKKKMEEMMRKAKNVYPKI